MRPICLAHLDRQRPVLVLTRELVRPHLDTITVAPITSTVRGLSSEVAVGAVNGLERPSVVICDDITTIRADALGRQIGVLFDRQELALWGFTDSLSDPRLAILSCLSPDDKPR